MSLRQYRLADHHFTSNEYTYYWQEYGLTRDPFPVIPDYSLTLLLARWEHHLDLLQHLIHTENVVLAVLGPKGSGKTTLLQQLVNQLGDSMFIHRAISRPNLDLNQLVKLIHDGFKLPVIDSDLVEEKLDSLIADIQYQERICVLAIDNAQDLPEETLQGLLYLTRQQSKTQMRFHVVLFGDHELQMKLAKIAKQDMSGDTIHSLEIEPLTLDETKQYLQHRLTAAGLQDNMPLSATTIETIFHESNGLPEHINRLAQQALIDDLAGEQNFMTASSSQGFFSQHLTKILGGVVVALFLAVTSYFVKGQHQDQNVFAHKQQENNIRATSFAQNDQVASDTQPTYIQNSSANANQNIQASQNANIPGQVPMPSNVNVANTTQQNGQTIVAVNNNANNSANPTDDADSAYFQNNHIVPAQQVQAQTQTQTQTATPIANNQVTQQIPSQNNNINNNVNQNNVASNAMQVQPAIPVAAATSNSQVQAQPSAPVAVASNTLAQAQTKAAPVPAQTNVITATQSVQTQATKVAQEDAPIDPLKRESMIAKKSKVKKAVPAKTIAKAKTMTNDKNGRYTIQVIALSSEAAARKFIASNHMNGKMQVIKTTRDGKTLYILTYGAYASNAQAQSAIKSLPQSIQKNKVWARSFASLKS